MTYRIRIYRKAAKFLGRCEEGLAGRIREKLRLLEERPFLYLERLEGREEFKLRIGDYRAIVDVEENVLRVLYIDHRSRVYKRFR